MMDRTLGEVGRSGGDDEADTSGEQKTIRGLFGPKHVPGSRAAGGQGEEARCQGQAWLSVKSPPAVPEPAESLGSARWGMEGGTICSAKTLELHSEGRLDPSPVLRQQRHQGAPETQRSPEQLAAQ